MWIDIDYGIKVGAIGYLVRTVDTNSGRDAYGLRERPARTNRSNAAKLDGWCGETNNRSVYAEGVARVVRLNFQNERAQVVAVTGAELDEFLERDGYPELMKDA